jgi:hypothetical protein
MGGRSVDPPEVGRVFLTHMVSVPDKFSPFKDRRVSPGAGYQTIQTGKSVYVADFCQDSSRQWRDAKSAAVTAW